MSFLDRLDAEDDEEKAPKKKPEEKGYVRRAVEAIPSGIEFGTGMIAQMPAYLGGAIAGLGTAAATGDPEAGTAVQEAVMQSPLTNPWKLLPHSKKSEQMEEMVGHGVEAGATAFGRLNARLEAEEVEAKHGRKMTPEEENRAQTYGEAAVNLGANFAPIPGAKAIERMVTRKPAPVVPPLRPEEARPTKPIDVQSQLPVEEPLQPAQERAMADAQARIQAAQEAAQGELRSMQESQEFLRREETGTRDMFGQDAGFDKALRLQEPLGPTARELPDLGFGHNPPESVRPKAVREFESGEPKQFPDTSIPFEPQPDAPRLPPRGQRGSVDPSVFLEGLGKLIGVVPKSLEAARSFLERGIESAKDRRDVLTRKTYQDKLDQINSGELEAGKVNTTRQLQQRIFAEDDARLGPLGGTGKKGFGQGGAVGGDKDLQRRLAPKLQELKDAQDAVRRDPDDELAKLTLEQLQDEISELRSEKVASKRTPVISPEEEKVLVEKVQKGDEKAFAKAFAKLFNTYKRRLERDLYSFFKDDPAMREDVVQETFRRAYQSMAAGKYEGRAAFYSWLYGIGKNAALNEKERASNRPMVHYDALDEGVEQDPSALAWMKDPAHIDSPEKILEAKEESERIQAALNSLDDMYRVPLELKEVEGLSNKMIGELLGQSTAVIDKRIQRAREELGHKLGGVKMGGAERGYKGDTWKGPKKERGAIDPDLLGINKLVDRFFKGVKKGDHMSGIKEVAQQFRLDKSKVPLVEFLGENLKPEEFKDISEFFDKRGSRIMTDKTISIMAQGTKGSDKILKWVIDNEKIIDQRRDVRVEAAIKGEKYDKGIRGFSKRLWGEEGALTLWRQMGKKHFSELVEMKEEWVKSMIQGRSPQFQTARQKASYEAIQKQFDAAREYVNGIRAKFDLPPIEKIENYFPALRMGEYRVAIKDGLGNMKGYYGFSDVFQAKAFAYMIRKDMPHMKTEDPYHIKRGKYDLDTSAFEEAMRQYSSTDPAAVALKAAYDDIVGKRGFGGKRLLHKDNILGFMGSEKGDIGVRNAEKAIETYLTKMYTYGSNLEKGLIHKEVAALPADIKKQIPNTISLVHDFMIHARGGELKQHAAGVDSLAQYLGRASGFGESGSSRALSGVKSTIGAYWLFTPKFVTSQLFQHLNTMAKMVELHGEGAQNPVAAYFTGIKNTIKPDNESVAAANWARRHGYLDSVIVELLGSDIGSGESSITKAIKSGTSWTLGKVEQEFVRLPTFLMFENQLRSTIKDPIKRAETAAELMDHYMVNYRQAAKPMVYNHLGEALGGSAAPLKQYSHNAYGQFFEYVKGLGQNGMKGIAPLATFMGTQALVGGLKGVILVAEANAIIAAINWMRQNSGDDSDPLPSVGEALMNWGASDFLTFGLASTITGQDMSNSLAAPNVPGMFSLPPVAFTVEAASAVINWLAKSLNGKDEDSDAMRALIAVTPNQAHAAIEKMFTGPNQPVPNPRANMSGTWIRSEDEWIKDMVFSGRSIDEARSQALSMFGKADLLYNEIQKRTTLSAIASKIEQGKEVDPKLIEAYVKQGGSVKGLNQAVKQEIMNRNFTYLERQQMHKPSTGQARRMEVLKPKLENAPPVKRGFIERLEAE